MNEKNPLVSIVATSYNFEKFIPYFMDSVLSQPYGNWELIVTDDCSTDRSFEILKLYERKDARIKVFQNDKNRHVCHTINNSLKKASGDYVCLMSCDDAFLPEKLSHDVDFMEKNPEIGVLYGQIYQMDENNVLVGKYASPKDFERFSLLKEMFLSGNQLLSPGTFMRKGIVDAVGSFHPLLKMTQDYEYHIRLLFNTKPAYSFELLVKYRRMSNNSNLSGFAREMTNSEQNETFFLLGTYLEHIKEYVLLQQIFPEVTEFGPEDNRLVPYYLGRIALSSRHNYVKLFGMRVIYDFMLDTGNVAYLEEKVGFLPKDLMEIVSQNRIFCSPGFVEHYPVRKKIKTFIYRRVKRIERIIKHILRINISNV